MIFFLRIIVIGVLSYLVSLFLPWWSVVFISFSVSFFMPGNDINVLLSGFISVGVLWLIQSWQLHIANEALISKQVVHLFGYSDPIALVIYSGVIGAILGGLSALTGHSFRRLYMKDKKKRFYS